MRNYFYLIFLIWNMACSSFSATYYYQLYPHAEYYNQPPGFPSKLPFGPIANISRGKGDGWKESRYAAGALGILRLSRNHTWVEIMAAYGGEHVNFNHQGVLGKKTRVGWDDCLIDVGHNFLDESGKKQLVLHLLSAIPIGKKISLAEIESPLWGYRSYATGPVIELLYDFIRTSEQDLFSGFMGRFMHYFKKRYEPILPPDAFYNPGKSVDLFTFVHYRYKLHNLEIAYVYTIFNNRFYIFPTTIEYLPSKYYNTFYITYNYYYEKISTAFELQVAGIQGTYNQFVIMGLVEWYF